MFLTGFKSGQEHISVFNFKKEFEMKKLSVLLLLISTTAFAKIDPTVKVWLGNNKKKSLFHEHKVVPELPWLDVKDEELKFPEKSIILTHVRKAIEILPKVLNSEEFKQGILAYTRKNGKQEFSRNYLWNNKEEKLTNKEILNTLFEGNEYTLPKTENQMNLHVKMKKCKKWENIFKRKWCKGIIGHTYPKSSEWITVNWQFYKGYKAPQIVNNLVHEWIHLLGFTHGPKKTMGEEITYVAGKLAQRIAQKMINQEN